MFKKTDNVLQNIKWTLVTSEDGVTCNVMFSLLNVIKLAIKLNLNEKRFWENSSECTWCLKCLELLQNV